MAARQGLIGRFVLGITADTKPLERNLKRGVRRVDEFERSFRKVTLAANKVYQPVKRVTQSVISLRGALTTLAGGGVLGAGIKQLSDYGAEIQHTADRLDIGVEKLQRWRLEVEGTGVGQRNLNVALTAFARRRSEALAGNRGYAKVFEELNVQLVDAAGNTRANQDVLEDFLQAVRRLPDAGDQFRVLQTAMSETGRPLRDWIANSEAATAAVADLRVNTEAELKAVTDLNQSFSNTGQVIKTELLTGLAAASGRMDELNMRIRDLARRHGPGLVEGLVDVGEATLTVGSQWKALLAIWFGAKFASFPAKLGRLDEVIKGLSSGTVKWADLTKGTLIPALAGVGGAALTAIILYRKEIKGVIDDIREATGGENAPKKLLADSFAFGSPLDNAALVQAKREYKELFVSRANAEKQLASLRRRGYQESSVDVLKFQKIVDDSTAGIVKLAARIRAIYSAEAAAAKEAIPTGPSRFGIGSQAGAAPPGVSTIAAGIGGQLPAWRDDFGQLRKDLKDANDLIQSMGTAALYEQMGQLVGSADALDAGMARAVAEGAAFASLMEGARKPLEVLHDRGQAVGDSLKSSFAGLDNQIKSILGNTDSWGDALERIGRVLIYTGISSLGGKGGVLQALFGTPGRAIGGPMYAGQPYVAGENGPEYVIPRTDSMAIPAGRMGATTVNVSTSVTATGPVDAAAADRISEAAAVKVMAVLGQQQYNRNLVRRNG